MFKPATDVADARRIIASVTAATTTHDLEFEGSRVRWRSLGSGSPLVLLHGGHGNWLHWVRNAEALARQHTVWLPDMPGYGESGPLAGANDLANLVRTTVATLNQLLGADTDIDLGGFSFGGLVAAHVAKQRGHIRKIGLVGSAGHGTPRRQSIPMVNWRRSDDEAAMLADLRHNLLALMIHDPADLDALALEVHRLACVNTHFRSKALSQAAKVPELLADMHVPMLFAWGEHDVTAQAALAGPVLQDGHPERTWLSLAGAGHWVQFEQPARINELLLRWFAPA